MQAVIKQTISVLSSVRKCTSTMLKSLLHAVLDFFVFMLPTDMT